MTLKVEIATKNMELTQRIEEYVTKKVAKLDHFLPDVEDARVDLTHAKSARNASDRQVVEITLRGKGYILRVEERADDIFTAIDTANDKMQRQISRLKGKRSRGRGDGKSASEVVPEVITPDESVRVPSIVRRKQFTLTPMDELEAIEQMQLLGHDNFFIFYNANTSSINVLYRRRDGSYGLIEPLMG